MERTFAFDLELDLEKFLASENGASIAVEDVTAEYIYERLNGLFDGTFPGVRVSDVHEIAPSDASATLDSELLLLSRLIGTHDTQGRAEARGIVERAREDAAAMLAELAACLDMLAGALPHAPRIADLITARIEAAKAVIAKAEGRANV